MKEPIFEPIVRYFRFRKILEQIQPNTVVVDIGCGHTPHLLNRLEKYIKKGIGLDPLIKNRQWSNITLISGELGKDLKLKPNLADYVTLAAVLEHVDNPKSVLEQSYCLLKPGGTILITTPTPLNKPLLEFLSFRLGLISRREIAEHKRYYWRKELVSQLKSSGFRNISHHYFELFLNNFAMAQK